MRKILLWIHLAVGVTVAAIVMPMSVTGVLSMCEKQTIVWSDRGFRFASITGRVPIEKILAAEPNAASVTIYSDPGAAASVSPGCAGAAFFDAHTGAKLGRPLPKSADFSAHCKAKAAPSPVQPSWISLPGRKRILCLAAACKLVALPLGANGSD